MNKLKLVILTLSIFICIQSLKAQAALESVYPKYPTITDTLRKHDLNLNKNFPFNIVLKDSLGNFYSSENVLVTKGKPLVLLFWMTTCGPCRLEMEAIKNNVGEWQKEVDFRLLAISMDFPNWYGSYVERVKKENWPFETFYDVHRQFCDVMPYGGLNGLPQLFIVNEQGDVLYYHHRYQAGDEADLFAALKKLKK